MTREAVEQPSRAEIIKVMMAAKDEHLWYEVPGPGLPRARRCSCGWTNDAGLGWLDAWELHVLNATLDAALAAGCLLPETAEHVTIWSDQDGVPVLKNDAGKRVEGRLFILRGANDAD